MFSFLLSFIPNIKIFKSVGSQEKIQNELSLAIADLDARCSAEYHKSKFSNNISERQAKIDHSDCFKKYGVLTDIQANHGIIDKVLLFDVSIAGSVWHDLKIGLKIQYLAYKISDDIPIKVVKILSIINDQWDKPLNAQATDELLETLRSEKPEYFSVHQRSVLGVIMERKGSKMTVECDNKTIIYVDLETVQSQFVPMVGDLICLNCNVQSDATFVDMSGEILDVISIYPTRSKTIKGKITVIKQNGLCGHIDEQYFFLMESAEMGYRPAVGDIVIGDAIESNQGVCTWRCIKIVLFEKNIQKSSIILNENDNNYNINNDNNNNNNKSNPMDNENSKPINQIKSQPVNGIEVTDNLNVTLNQLNEVKFIRMLVKNTTDKQHQILRSTIMESKANSQILLKKPKRFDNFYLQPMEEFEYLFEVRSKFIGKNVERVAIQFVGNFRIIRNIEINVNCTVNDHDRDNNNKDNYNDDDDVDDADNNNRNTVVVQRPVIQKRFNTAYTKDVWNKTGDIIPGEKLKRAPHFVSVRLPQFDVPLNLQKILEFKTSDDVENYLDMSLPFFNGPLTITNYAQCFHSLLHLEELQAFHNIRVFDMERAHFTHDNTYLVLHVANVQESRPSLVIGDSVRITNPWTVNKNNQYIMYEGVIHKVQKDNVLIKFTKSFHDKYNGEDYQVEFFFSRFPYRKQHYAVKRAVGSLGQDLLFPTKLMLKSPQLPVEIDGDGDLWCVPPNKLKQKLKWYNGCLNEVQKEAIVNILNGVTRPMPYIIFGPPGTGKTVTVIETILQICCNVSESRIIVATSSNSSANLITERLIESGVLKPGDFIRIVGHNIIEREMIPEHLLPYCGTCDISLEGTVANEMLVTDSGLKLRCSSGFLGRHKITIATCLTIGTLLQMKFPRDHFTHVLIDECGQCRESEAIIPMIFINPKCGQIILAGDPMQLGPIILNKSAVRRGFDKSILVRLLERFPYQKDNTRFEKGFDARLVTKLLYNYRALPSVMKMYNELFYDSELISTICERTSNEIKLLKKINKILPNCDVIDKTHGIFFIGITGTNQRCSDSPSWFNSAEVRSMFVFLIKLYEAGCTSNDIGILSPYQQQVKSIRLMIRDANLQMPKVGSVEEFQGQERNIILISTVRSTKALVPEDLKYSLGFVENSKRLNVAISRARALVVIFGNPNLLMQDQSWKTLIQHCVDSNAYVGCPLSKHK